MRKSHFCSLTLVLAMLSGAVLADLPKSLEPFKGHALSFYMSLNIGEQYLYAGIRQGTENVTFDRLRDNDNVWRMIFTKDKKTGKSGPMLVKHESSDAYLCLTADHRQFQLRSSLSESGSPAHRPDCQWSLHEVKPTRQNAQAGRMRYLFQIKPIDQQGKFLCSNGKLTGLNVTGKYDRFLCKWEIWFLATARSDGLIRGPERQDPVPMRNLDIQNVCNVHSCLHWRNLFEGIDQATVSSFVWAIQNYTSMVIESLNPESPTIRCRGLENCLSGLLLHG